MAARSSKNGRQRNAQNEDNLQTDLLHEVDNDGRDGHDDDGLDGLDENL